jgi:hypothetical protein
LIVFITGVFGWSGWCDKCDFVLVRRWGFGEMIFSLFGVEIKFFIEGRGSWGHWDETDWRFYFFEGLEIIVWIVIIFWMCLLDLLFVVGK